MTSFLSPTKGYSPAGGEISEAIAEVLSGVRNLDASSVLNLAPEKIISGLFTDLQLGGDATLDL
jgi:hypothetical protein